MLQILVINSHANNRGDEAAQRAMVDNILHLHPDAKFTFLTNNPAALDIGFEGIVSKQPSVALRRASLLYCLAIMPILRASPKLALWFYRNNRNLVTAIKAILAADIVISAPGGPYIGSLYSAHEIQEHLLLLAVCLVLRKDIAVYGPSMGPFDDGFLRNLLRRMIVGRVRIIAVRDPVSFAYLRRLNLSRPLMVLTADSAFQPSHLQYPSKGITCQAYTQKSNSNELIVGVTPTAAAWNYRGIKNAHELQDSYVDEFAKLMQDIGNSFECRFIFFPQLYGKQSDMGLIKSIIGRVEKCSCCSIVEQSLNSLRQISIIRELDCFIGNRYHSVIFSLANCVPCLAIAYEHKTAGIMHEFGLDQYVLPIKEFTAGIAFDLFRRMRAEDSEIRSKICKRLPLVQHRALMNSYLVSALLSKNAHGSAEKPHAISNSPKPE